MRFAWRGYTRLINHAIERYADMAKIRVGINGFGRIGRNFFRAYLEQGHDFEIVAANDLGDVKTMAHLLKHDSVLGTLAASVEAGDGFIPVRDPANTLLSAGAARAICVVLPELKGKVDGMSMRAPVPTGSIVDLVVQVARETTKDDVNALFRSKADTGDLEGILQYTDEPLVSTDVIHSSYSAVFDSGLTMVNGPLVKVFGWYDNEWGYSCRLVDLVAKIAQTMPAAVAA